MKRVKLPLWKMLCGYAAMTSCSLTALARDYDTVAIPDYETSTPEVGLMSFLDPEDVYQEEEAPPEPIRVARNVSRPAPATGSISDDSQVVGANATIPAIEPAVSNPVEELAEDDEIVAPAEAPVAEKHVAEKQPIQPPAPPLTAEQIQMRTWIRNCIGYYYARPESTADHSPWGLMHCLISFGVDTNIYERGRKTNAVGFLCWNNASRGQRILTTQNGQLRATVGPGVQGHEGQFLAMLAQSKVPHTYPLQVNRLQYTIDHLVESEKATCQPRSELTFKLIGLSHYLDSDDTWRDRYNREWSIPRLISEELQQPVVGAACGGTHRLMGFSYALYCRQREGKPITGEWKRAETYRDDYLEHAFRLQNRDGSFSTRWFEGRDAKNDDDRRLQTSGHILEWIVFSLPREQLLEPRVVRAVNYVTALMLNNRSHDWEIGHKGHALRALVLYDQKVFDGRMGLGASNLEVARKP